MKKQSMAWLTGYIDNAKNTDMRDAVLDMMAELLAGEVFVLGLFAYRVRHGKLEKALLRSLNTAEQAELFKYRLRALSLTDEQELELALLIRPLGDHAWKASAVCFNEEIYWTEEGTGKVLYHSIFNLEE